MIFFGFMSQVLPEEKDWMLASAHGKLGQLKKLLETHPSLVKKKDFLLVSFPAEYSIWRMF